MPASSSNTNQNNSMCSWDFSSSSDNPQQQNLGNRNNISDSASGGGGGSAAAAGDNFMMDFANEYFVQRGQNSGQGSTVGVSRGAPSLPLQQQQAQGASRYDYSQFQQQKAASAGPVILSAGGYAVDPRTGCTVQQDPSSSSSCLPSSLQQLHPLLQPPATGMLSPLPAVASSLLSDSSINNISSTIQQMQQLLQQLLARQQQMQQQQQQQAQLEQGQQQRQHPLLQPSYLDTTAASVLAARGTGNEYQQQGQNSANMLSLQMMMAEPPGVNPLGVGLGNLSTMASVQHQGATSGQSTSFGSSNNSINMNSANGSIGADAANTSTLLDTMVYNQVNNGGKVVPLFGQEASFLSSISPTPLPNASSLLRSSSSSPPSATATGSQSAGRSHGQNGNPVAAVGSQAQQNPLFPFTSSIGASNAFANVSMYGSSTPTTITTTTTNSSSVRSTSSDDGNSMGGQAGTGQLTYGSSSNGLPSHRDSVTAGSQPRAFPGTSHPLLLPLSSSLPMGYALSSNTTANVPSQAAATPREDSGNGNVGNEGDSGGSPNDDYGDFDNESAASASEADSSRRRRRTDSNNNNHMSWMDRYRQLLHFKREFGHCRVPNRYRANIQLAKWVKRQRYQYKLKQQGKHTPLTPEREQMLDDIDFIWNSYDTSWDVRYTQLIDYNRRHGHCKVPSNYPENQPLANWAKCQRRQFQLFCSNYNKNGGTASSLADGAAPFLAAVSSSGNVMDDPSSGLNDESTTCSGATGCNNNKSTLTVDRIMKLARIGFVFSNRTNGNAQDILSSVTQMSSSST